MRVIVDAGRCQAHGQCNFVCPEIFKLDEWGYAFTESEEVPEGMETPARQAANACPERAISLEI
jgi:ferredoxin